MERKYTVAETKSTYVLREIGTDKYALVNDGRNIAMFSTRSEAQLYLDRMNSPNYPFSDAMVFCSEHCPDSDICDVIECDTCGLATGN